MKWSWRSVRDGVLLTAGLYLAIHECVYTPPPVDVPTLILASGMMGLPGVFRS